MFDLINKAESAQNPYAEMLNNYKANKSGNKNSLVAEEGVKEDSAHKTDVFEMNGKEECQTCKNRKYQDGSNDSSVSYQNPTKISRSAAASAVKAHEMEHVRNNQAKAKQEGKEIVSQYVRIKTGICPECGDTYVAGGETVTVSRTVPDNEQPQTVSDKSPEAAENAAEAPSEQGNVNLMKVGKAQHSENDSALPEMNSYKSESQKPDESGEKFEIGKTKVEIGEFLDEIV